MLTRGDIFRKAGGYIPWRCISAHGSTFTATRLDDDTQREVVFHGFSDHSFVRYKDRKMPNVRVGSIIKAYKDRIGIITNLRRFRGYAAEFRNNHSITYVVAVDEIIEVLVY
jgi:hypothetical protein